VQTVFNKSKRIRSSFDGATDLEKVALRQKALNVTLLDQLRGIDHFAAAPLPRAMKWGRDNEPVALNRYVSDLPDSMKCQHFEVIRPGLLIDPKIPYLGASPDAIVGCGFVGCECYGWRLVEIKCPHSCETSTVENAPFWDQKHKEETGQLLLDRKNPFYLQMIMQMALTRADDGGVVHKCDFYAWCPMGTGNGVQKEPELIEFNLALWEEVRNNISWFYEDVFLPFHLS